MGNFRRVFIILFVTYQFLLISVVPSYAISRETIRVPIGEMDGDIKKALEEISNKDENVHQGIITADKYGDILRFGTYNETELEELEVFHEKFLTGEDRLTVEEEERLFCFLMLIGVDTQEAYLGLKNTIVLRKQADGMKKYTIYGENGVYLGYDFGFSDDDHVALQEGKDRWIEYLKKREFSNLVDLGCGIGSDLIHMAENNPGVKFYGFDANHLSIGKAISSAGMIGLSNLILQARDFSILPFPDDSVDVLVLFSDVFYKQREIKIKPAIKEMLRVLKEDGEIIFMGQDKYYSYIEETIKEVGIETQNLLGENKEYVYVSWGNLRMDSFKVLDKGEYKERILNSSSYEEIMHNLDLGKIHMIRIKDIQNIQKRDEITKNSFSKQLAEVLSFYSWTKGAFLGSAMENSTDEWDNAISYVLSRCSLPGLVTINWEMTEFAVSVMIKYEVLESDRETMDKYKIDKTTIKETPNLNIRQTYLRDIKGIRTGISVSIEREFLSEDERSNIDSYVRENVEKLGYDRAVEFLKVAAPLYNKVQQGFIEKSIKELQSEI